MSNYLSNDLAAHSAQTHTDAQGREGGVYRYGVVLGCPRSGTTFMMRVLNTLPDAECITGTLLPVAVPHVVNQDLDPPVYEALAVGFERALDAYLHSGRYHSRAAALQKWMSTRTGLGGLIDALRGRRTERQLIYKEPFLSLAPDFVYHALPGVKIVHLYRDGRDCANSLVRSYDVLTDDRLTHLRGSEMRLGRRYDERYVPWWVEEGRDREFIDSSPYVRAIWMWKYMVRRCHDALNQPDVQASGQVLHVRYEDLMRAPMDHWPNILEHFGLSPTRSFYRRIQRSHTQSIGKHEWRDEQEVKAAEQVARNELELYGYL